MQAIQSRVCEHLRPVDRVSIQTRAVEPTNQLTN